MVRYIKRRTKLIYYKLKYGSSLKLGTNVTIDSGSTFEGMNKINSNSHFYGHLGFGTYIGSNSDIIGNIGKFTSIAPFVRINPGKHPTKGPFVSTSPFFYSSRKQNGHSIVKEELYNELASVDGTIKNTVIIGHDVWIGDGAFIVGGVTIGNGAVVLSHAVVTKDVAPYSIVGGIPAKHIDYRFDSQTIAFLMDFKWWEKDISWLKNNIDSMADISRLINKFS